MPLSTRELYLVLRARDEASRVIHNVSGSLSALDAEAARLAHRNMQRGAMLTNVGTGIAVAGAVGVNALNNMTTAAIEYRQEASKTMTQTDKVKTSVQQLEDIGRQVAKSIPAPLEQMQGTLYDIFSSMDTNITGARKLLKQLARDAVGGATDMETAGRAEIQILNAFKIPIKDVSRVSDVMFQLVRKGVGTYQQFATTIGRATPSAIRAGQSIESLAGMLAFLTRNGLSTAMAATSAARALDALSNPKAIKNLKELGVNVVNKKGQFKPLVDIIEEMRKKTEKMSAPKRSKWLTDAFKGAGGTIQAMRFFNLALGDSHNLLPKMTDDMKHAKGAAKDAYKVMANTPQAKIQLLHNRWQALRQEVGDRLIPVKLALIDLLNRILAVWDKLSPKTKDMIVKWTAVGTALMTVIGAATAVAGMLLALRGAMALAGVGIGGFLGPIGIVVGALTLLVTGGYLVYKNWDKIWPAIKRVFDAVWPTIVHAAQTIWLNFKYFGEWWWGTFGPFFTRVWDAIKTAAQKAWPHIVDAAQAIWSKIKDFGNWFWTTFGPTITHWWGLISGMWEDGLLLVVVAERMWNAVKAFGQWFWQQFGPGLTAAWNSVKEAFGQAWGAIQTAFKQGWDALKPAFQDLMTTLKLLWSVYGPMLMQIWDKVLKPLIGLFLLSFVVLFVHGLEQLAAAAVGFANFFKAVIGPLIRFITTTLGAIMKVIRDFVGIVTSIINGDWRKAWEYCYRLVRDMIHGIWGILKTGWDLIVSVVEGIVRGVIGWFKTMYDSLIGHSIIPDLINGIIIWFKRLPGSLLAIAQDIWNKVVRAFNEGWSAVYRVMSAGVQWVKDKFSGAKTWLVNAGTNIIQGLTSGISSALTNIRTWIKSHVVDPIIGAVKEFFGIHSPSTVFAGLGGHLMSGLMSGMMGKGGASSIIKTVFGSMPKALSAILGKGLIGISGLPGKALDALSGLFGGAFGGTGPMGVGRLAQNALSRVGSKFAIGMCLSFVRQMAGAPGGQYDAIAAWRDAKFKHAGDRRPPSGVPVFWGGGHGHVAASIGGGRIVTTDYPVAGRIGLTTLARLTAAWHKQYLGWTNDINGVMTSSFGLGGPGGSGVTAMAKGGMINEHVWGVGASGRRYELGERGNEMVIPTDAGNGAVAMRNLLRGSGGQIAVGLANGIMSSSPVAVAAIKRVANYVVNAANDVFGISSPSKRFIQVGQWINTGLYVGLMSNKAKVLSTIKTLGNQMVAALESSVTVAHRKTVTKIVNHHRKRITQVVRTPMTAREADRAVGAFLNANKNLTNQLIKLAGQRDAVATKMQQANAKLADLVKTRNEYAVNVQNAARSFASITTITAQEGKALTADDLVKGLQAKLAAIQRFSGTISALARRGVNRTTLDQIIQSGVENGQAFASALLQSRDFNQVNVLQDQINKATSALGNNSADRMYKAGIDAQKGLIRGLQSQSKALTQAADHFADILVARVKRKLGIRSPSRIMHSLGAQTMQGFNNGMRSRGPDISWLNALTSHHGGTGYGGAPGMQDRRPRLEQHFHITTQEIDPRKHAADLGWELATRVAS